MPPNTREGMEKYLASGMVKGIGPIYAKRLIARFGEELFEVIEKTPNSLEHSGQVCAEAAYNALSRQYAEVVSRDTSLELLRNGVAKIGLISLRSAIGNSSCRC
jgi:exodeoxyribonuclease V alpha subunit